MSANWEWQGLVSQRSLGDARRKGLLNVLAGAADEEGHSFWGLCRLASTLDVSDKTVSRWIAELELRGLIRRHRRRAENGRLSTWDIWLVWDAIEALPPSAWQSKRMAAASGQIVSGGPTPPEDTHMSGGPADTLDVRAEPQVVNLSAQEPNGSFAETPVPLSSQSREVAIPTAAENLCAKLASAVERQRGCDRPKVTAKWLKDMRLLVERGPLHVDKPEPMPPDRVEGAIDFVFGPLAEPGKDGFCWADQIRSPGALRDHWHQLRDAGRRLQAVVRSPSDRRDALRGVDAGAAIRRAREERRQRDAYDAVSVATNGQVL